MENIRPRFWSKADQAKQIEISSQEPFPMREVLGQWNSLMKEMVDARGSGGRLENVLEEKAIFGQLNRKYPRGSENSLS